MKIRISESSCITRLCLQPEIDGLVTVGERKCAFEGCNALEFRTSGYCLRHKGGLPNEKTSFSETPEKTRPEPVTITDPLLIPKIALGYVPFVWFLLFLTSFNGDAFDGYYFFIYSGMCLVFLLPLYAVYLVGLTWQRFKDGTLTLSVFIIHILSFMLPFTWFLLFATFSGSPA